MEKTQVFVIEYDESKEEKLKKILDSKPFMKIVARINSTIGEITNPYKGYSKPVEDSLDDIFLVMETRDVKEYPLLQDIIDRVRAKRCLNVRKTLMDITKSTNPDLAHIACHHVAHCRPCQEWAMDVLQVGADKELESYIAYQLS